MLVELGLNFDMGYPVIIYVDMKKATSEYANLFFMGGAAPMTMLERVSYDTNTGDLRYFSKYLMSGFDMEYNCYADATNACLYTVAFDPSYDMMYKDYYNDTGNLIMTYESFVVSGITNIDYCYPLNYAELSPTAVAAGRTLNSNGGWYFIDYPTLNDTLDGSEPWIFAFNINYSYDYEVYDADYVVTGTNTCTNEGNILYISNNDWEKSTATNLQLKNATKIDNQVTFLDTKIAHVTANFTVASNTYGTQIDMLINAASNTNFLTPVTGVSRRLSTLIK